MRLTACLFVALATCCASLSLAQDHEPLTKLSSREMTPEQLARRFFGELAETLLPVEYRRRGRPAPTRRLVDLKFWTRPTAAEDGLCQTHRLTVHFDSIDGSDSPKTAVRVRGITSETHFIVQEPRAFAIDHVTQHGFSFATERACLEKDPRTGNLIWNDGVGSQDVANALRRLARVTATTPLDCDGIADQPWPSMTEPQCRAFVLSANPTKVTSIGPCTYAVGCSEVMVGDRYSITLEEDGQNLRVQVDEPIIHLTEIID